MAKRYFYNSTIFNKVVMAGTGVILVLFLVGHLLGNLQVFIGRDVFNAYSAFLKSSIELLWGVRLFLLLMIVLHVYTSIKLKLLNLQAKPEGYSKKAFVRSTVYSRSMIYSGIALALFIAYHLMHFTGHVFHPEYTDYHENHGPVLGEATAMVSEAGAIMEVEAGQGIFERHDTYKMVIKGFSDPVISIVYIVAMIFLMLHLSHAVQSMFQTLGFDGPQYSRFSKLLAIFLSIGFISIPVAILLGYGQGVLG